MGRAPNRRDLGPQPGPDQPSSYSAGKIQSRKAPAPAHGKKPLQEPITAIAHKVTGFGAQQPYAYNPHTPASGVPLPPRPTPHVVRTAGKLFFGGAVMMYPAPPDMMRQRH